MFHVEGIKPGMSVRKVLNVSRETFMMFGPGDNEIGKLNSGTCPLKLDCAIWCSYHKGIE